MLPGEIRDPIGGDTTGLPKSNGYPRIGLRPKRQNTSYRPIPILRSIPTSASRDVPVYHKVGVLRIIMPINKMDSRKNGPMAYARFQQDLKKVSLNLAVSRASFSKMRKAGY